MSVSELEGAEADDYAARAAEALNVASGQMAYAKALDIAIVKDGAEVTPDTPVSVSIRLLDAPQVDDTTNVNVLHFGKEVEPVSCALNGENVEFEADGFSVYLVAYTVDFHWGDYTYSIAGESEIRLSELFEKLGVNEIALADIENVTFSNPALVGVEKLDSDWLLKSLAPFQTEEALVLALKNGQSVEIRVTDENDPTVVGSWSCGATASDNVTCTLYSNGDMVVSGTGAMEDYTRKDWWVKDTPWYVYIKDENSPVKKVIVEDGITRIGTNAFCRAYNIESIDVRNCTSLVSIGESTFKMDKKNITKLKTASFANCVNLTTIDAQAFRHCLILETVDTRDRSMIMYRHLKQKLRSRAGETIAETLVALLISALALVMLAGAIGTAHRIITRSETQMQRYYKANNDLAVPGTSSGDDVTVGEPTISIVNKDGTEIKLNGTDSIGFKYGKNVVFRTKPVVAYVKKTVMGGD